MCLEEAEQLSEVVAVGQVKQPARSGAKIIEAILVRTFDRTDRLINFYQNVLVSFENVCLSVCLFVRLSVDGQEEADGAAVVEAVVLDEAVEVVEGRLAVVDGAVIEHSRRNIKNIF